MEKINFIEVSKNVRVLLSTFNEENNIKELISRILKILPDCEIMLTHGGNDNTANYAQQLAKKLKNKNIKIIVNPNDRGAGHGLKISILNCSRPIMVNIDSDIQFAPEEIPSLLKPILTKKYKVVFGSRFLKNSGKKNYKGSFLRDKGNMIIASVVSILANRKFTDISAGFKAWTREAIIDTGYEDEKYCSFPELAIRCSFNNYDICEVPIKDMQIEYMVIQFINQIFS